MGQYYSLSLHQREAEVVYSGLMSQYLSSARGTLLFWLTFWEVEILGIDITGVDIVGVDILG